MSSTYLHIFPADPHWVPPPAARRRALRLVEAMFPVPAEPEPDEHSILHYPEPRGWEHEAIVYDRLEFIDPGENRADVLCPPCGQRTDIVLGPAVDWWHAVEDQAEENGWEGLRVKTPCCGRTVLATDLQFDDPGGFARFELSILDPSPSDGLTPDQLAQLEAALGCPVRQVWGHY